MARRAPEIESESIVTESSGNVFADLGLRDSEELLAKARLASAIQDVIDERGLTQVEAAKLMGIDQPKVSKIIRGQLSDFSTERLMHFLVLLGLDIEIVIHKQTTHSKKSGGIKVAYA